MQLLCKKLHFFVLLFKTINKPWLYRFNFLILHPEKKVSVLDTLIKIRAFIILLFIFLYLFL